MLPSLSAAVAVIATVAGSVNIAPADGDVIAAVGATFGFLTVMLIGKDTLKAPLLS